MLNEKLYSIANDEVSVFEEQYELYEITPPKSTLINVWDKDIKVEENGYYWNGDPILFKGQIETLNNPLVVELFSGCGGTSLGFEMAGFDIALGCDIHIPSIESFKINHPYSASILGDIKKIDTGLVTKALKGKVTDVLIGGIPCQGFSLNNRKRHEGDERNLMYKEFIRFVKELKPQIIVLENVSGMKSTGDFVKRIEDEISEAANMEVTSKLLYAPNYGVPQKRTRLVFVGVKNQKFDFGDILKTHGPEAEKPYVTVGDAIGDLPKLFSKEEAKSYTNKALTEYQKLMRKNVTNANLTNHCAPNHPQSTIEKIQNTKPGTPMYSNFKQRIRLCSEQLSPTQVSGGIRPQFQFGHPSEPRGLTIRERCRLQSFPDDFRIVGGIVQGRVQTGNAVPPFLAKAVALAIKKYL